MVNFRYHLVSIIAVFLALALGIVLGTYTINPVVVHNLRTQVKALRSDKGDLRSRVLQLDATSADVGGSAVNAGTHCI